MLTQDQNNENLDDFFKKSLEDYDIPYDPAAWEKMEKKLDTKTRISSNGAPRNGWKFLSVGLIFLFISVSVFTLINYGPIKESNENNRDQKLALKHEGELPALILTDSANYDTHVINSKKDIVDKNEIKKEKRDDVEANVNEKTAVNTSSLSNNVDPIRKRIDNTSPIKEDRSDVSDYLNIKNGPKYPSGNTKANRVPGHEKEKLVVKEKTDAQINQSFRSIKSASQTKITQQVITAQEEETHPDTNINLSPDSDLSQAVAESGGGNLKNDVKETNDVPEEITTTNVIADEEQKVESGPQKSDDELIARNNNPTNIAFNNEKVVTSDAKQKALDEVVVSNQEDENPVSVEDTIKLKEETLKTLKNDSLVIVADDSLKDEKEESDVIEEDFNRRGLSVGLTFSPDFSSVGFFDLIKPGTVGGIVLEYNISRRFSINTGYLYSTKIYSTEDDYESPQGIWYYYEKPDKIDGDCKVVDIPLNLRFNALSKPKYNLFITAGVSSYLMRKERYEYLYEDSSKDWTAVLKKKNNHYFGVVNFSLGYERFISKRVSLQVEPFLKMPAKGVGFWKVNLITSGAFFTIKYNILNINKNAGSK